MKPRIYFLDNLRTFLILLVVVIHAGLVYEPVLKNTWIVWDPDQSNAIGLIRMYPDLFIMFCLFFISGCFIPFSAKNKTVRAFVKSKFKRIMAPWMIAVLTLIPAYKFIFLYSRGLPQEKWYTYFHFFQRAGSDLSFYADNPTQNWLWFLPVLFMFQLLYLSMTKINLLPQKISLKTGIGLTVITGLAYSLVISHFNLRGWTHTAILHFQNERLLIYFLAFLLGTLANKLKVFETGRLNKKMFVISNIVLSVSMTIFTIIALNFFYNMIDPGREVYVISKLADRMMYYLTTLLLMLTFLHILIYLFKSKLDKTNPVLSQLGRYSYPVYIIHVIVMGVIALTLLNLPASGWIKFVLLTASTFALSNMIIYTWEKTIKNQINMKTIGTIAATIFILASAFSGNILKAKNENNGGNLQTLPQHAPGLHEAAISGNIEAVKQLIKKGTDLNVKESGGGATPLITACMFGETEIAKLLMAAGADLNSTNNEGSTALHTAAFFCRTEIVKALLESGADKSIKNNAGSTALEAVQAPFDALKPIYDYFENTFAPLGLKLDQEEIQKNRPVIALMLKEI